MDIRREKIDGDEFFEGYEAGEWDLSDAKFMLDNSYEIKKLMLGYDAM